MSDQHENPPSEDVLDGYLAVLVDESRRTVVKILAEEDRPIPLSLLAGWLTSGRRNASLDALPEHDRRQIEMRLHHTHLPKLESVGAVRYCPESGRITPGENIESVRALVEA
ncbi:DUF7344 domain-containing protein [Halopelagius longus]|uniref:DUF7344 domain-containing protein n=1 Tax=Halopelagius longus TaxID=1236180 RepID=A0A1H1DGX7_9EURY|nr:hypothetical protein [Halopelagius longus]RDI71327.1 hypothetical protein DWB78_06035 [Halopelagius longus]SDQ75640.1 hypothetical protein SAMN05216278_2405 [Halopelagius longus]